jgi:DNA-binding response OmpR family regulator
MVRQVNQGENIASLTAGDMKQVASPVRPAEDARRPVILVADDDVMLRNIVTILLQRQGYDVLSASDGQEGLDLSRKYPGTIDLAITDVDMPRLNGIELSVHLLEERPSIKIIVMSGADSHEIVSQNIHMPFLPKPFDGEVLLEKVRTLLLVPAQVSERNQEPSGASTSGSRRENSFLTTS